MLTDEMIHGTLPRRSRPRIEKETPIVPQAVAEAVWEEACVVFQDVELPREMDPPARRARKRHLREQPALPRPNSWPRQLREKLFVDVHPPLACRHAAPSRRGSLSPVARFLFNRRRFANEVLTRFRTCRFAVFQYLPPGGGFWNGEPNTIKSHVGSRPRNRAAAD